MKSLFLFFLIFTIPLITISQNSHVIKTNDGRHVLLKADFTWEYIDGKTVAAQPSEKAISTSNTSNSCILSDAYVEPKLNKKIQNQLKKGRATIAHVKKKIAKDFNCAVNDVVLLSVKEQKSKAVYHFCAKGKKVTYKRVGHVIIKSSTIF